MTRSMLSDDPILLVNAYLDGELDPPMRIPSSSEWPPILHLPLSTRAWGLCSDYCANGCPRSCAAGSARSHRGIHRHEPSARATILPRSPHQSPSRPWSRALDLGRTRA